MIKIDKVTTKQGDKGQTLGPGCKKISKNSHEMEFLGTIDELNSFVGELYFYVENIEIKNIIEKIQNDLFDIGACFFNKKDLNEIFFNFLEEKIEHFNKNLPQLTSFLLPKGNLTVVKLHIIRTITRRAERTFYKKEENIDLYPNIAIYLNRLSDIFFILLRQYESTEWIPFKG